MHIVNNTEAERLLKEGVYFITTSALGTILLGHPKNPNAMYKTGYRPLPIALTLVERISITEDDPPVEWQVLTLKEVILILGFDAEYGDNAAVRHCYKEQMEKIKCGELDVKHSFDLDGMYKFQYSSYDSIPRKFYSDHIRNRKIWQSYFESDGV